MAREVGYAAAFIDATAHVSKASDLFALPRNKVLHTDSLAVVKASLAGRMDAWQWVENRAAGSERVLLARGICGPYKTCGAIPTCCSQLLMSASSPVGDPHTSAGARSRRPQGRAKPRVSTKASRSMRPKIAGFLT